MHRRASSPVPLAALVAGVVAATFAACGGGDDGEGIASEPVPADPDAVIVADDMAFDPAELEVPADRPVTVVIDNQDDGVNHNVHVTEAPEPNRTPLEPGVSQQAITLTLPEGEYEFVCDIHPNMTGTLVAR